MLNLNEDLKALIENEIKETMIGLLLGIFIGIVFITLGIIGFKLEYEINTKQIKNKVSSPQSNGRVDESDNSSIHNCG